MSIAGRSKILLPWERVSFLRKLFKGDGRWKPWTLLPFLAFFLWFFGHTVSERQKLRATQTMINQVQHAVFSFRNDLGRCPRSIAELVHPPNRDEGYLRQVPIDGWGKEFYFRCPGQNHKGEADVVSAGKSGSFFVDDNIQ